MVTRVSSRAMCLPKPVRVVAGGLPGLQKRDAVSGTQVFEDPQGYFVPNQLDSIVTGSLAIKGCLGGEVYVERGYMSKSFHGLYRCRTEGTRDGAQTLVLDYTERGDETVFPFAVWEGLMPHV